MDNREETIQKALADLNYGRTNSIRAAAAAYGVPRSTLSCRLYSSLPHSIALAAHRRLTPDHKTFLAEWIIDLDSLGFPPSHTRKRETAARILRMNKDTKPLGKDWVEKFRQHHPEIAPCIGRRIAAKRIQRTKPDAIQAFYDRYEADQIDYGVTPANMWNMDEHGIALGIYTNSVVLAKAGKKAY
jgi:hypothetical protein